MLCTLAALLLTLLPTTPPPPAVPDKPEVAPAKPKEDGGYVITDKTEVFLDGKPCRYQDVDQDKAEIMTLEADPGTRRVTKLCFRTKHKE